MNKKVLISSVLVVAGLYLTACSKQEEPKTADNTTEQNPSEAPMHPLNQTAPAASTPAPSTPPPMATSEPQHSDMVMADDDTPPPPRPHHPKPRHSEPKAVAPAQDNNVEIQREATENTTTEIRREYKKPHTNTDAPKPHVEPVAATVADTPKADKPKRPSANLTQDDAVAAAMAAAKPAL